MSGDGVLDEAYLRLHERGPEFCDGLSNHGPMAAEALIRLNQAGQLHRWVDAYLPRLEDPPLPTGRLCAAEWEHALGRMDLVGDWLVLFAAELAQAPWRDVLARWWPRLLPGVLAGATHGLIRTGHAVRALAEVETAPRRAELAHALAYWAARWQPVTPSVRLSGTRAPTEVLPGLPLIAHQRGGISARMSQLAATTGWGQQANSVQAPAEPAEASRLLTEVADAALVTYAERSAANPVMLVHAVTAPSAILLVLPELAGELWTDSLAAGWAASAAVTSAYALPRDRGERPSAATPRDPGEAAERAARHGDEHVIKLTEAALRGYARGLGAPALEAAGRAVRLIEG